MNDFIPNGYIILARKIRKSNLWLSLKATHRLVMIELLLQAAYQDCEVVRNGEIIPLKRGQIATSYQMIADDIGDKAVTVKVVRNAIEKLEKHDFLAKDEAKARAKRGLLLTIVNYGVYQDSDNYKGKAEGNETGIIRAKQGQSEGKAGAIHNKLKNLNKSNNDLKDIYDYWNSLEIIKHRELTQKMQSSINARLKNMSFEEMKEAISNYNTIIKSELYWYTYKFTLEKFMNAKNIDQFLSENNPFETFRKQQGGGGRGQRKTSHAGSSQASGSYESSTEDLILGKPIDGEDENLSEELLQRIRNT
ncbi:hypothetical protein MKY98_07995 [Paenibacillus sp. FSL M8-0228]|uniref:hypothetical protein n=1 Tax=Paenibacillus sp. FSL M8-0228 TaxID=2921620 RepID=UPI0030F6AA10